MVNTAIERRLVSFLKSQPFDDAASAAYRLLVDPDTHSLTEKPSVEDVEEVLPVLKARQRNAVRQGLAMYGLEGLISSLERRSHSDKILGFSYSNEKFFGKFYLSGDRLLGFAVIDQSQKREKIATFQPG